MPSSLAAVAECCFNSSLNLIEVVLDLLVDLLLSLDMGIFSKNKASRDVSKVLAYSLYGNTLVTPILISLPSGVKPSGLIVRR